MSTLAGAELRSLNPATLEPVGSVPVSSPEEVREAVAAAVEAQAAWAGTGGAERAALLGRASRVLLDGLDELARLVTAEVGKPLGESYGWDALVGLEALRWLRRHAARELRPERVAGGPFFLHKRGRLVHEPLGVVGVISPWNLPFSIGFTQAAFAVAAGNAVVVKPSELAPLSAAWIERVFAEAGAPAGLVRVVHGGAEAGEALVRAPGVAKVVFTGSPEVGRAVARAAAEVPVPVTLELGGKDAMLVFADADLDRAADGAVWGAFSNCGQVCVAVERLYVEESVRDRFLEALVRRTHGLRLGAGDRAGVDVGPLVSERQRERVERLVAEALERGGQLLAGGRRADVGLPGWFYEPTVVAGVEIGEEVFGPVVTVDSFRGEDEAVARANASPYGLGASVWTRDLARARRVGDRLEAGMVWTNDSGYSWGSSGASWGGRKGSGHGRTNSRHGLYELSQAVYRDADSGRLGVPWWYPYGTEVGDGLRALALAWYGRDPGAAWRERRALVGLARRYRRAR